MLGISVDNASPSLINQLKIILNNAYFPVVLKKKYSIIAYYGGCETVIQDYILCVHQEILVQNSSNHQYKDQNCLIAPRFSYYCDM